MTTIHVCSSSSSANGYILESGGQSLILELGCKMMDYTLEVKDAFNTIKGGSGQPTARGQGDKPTGTNK